MLILLPMRKNLLTLSILMTFAAALGVANADSSRVQDFGYGSLSGTVVDSRGEPIQGALVSAYRFDREYKITEVAYTDDRGHWALPTVIAAEYTVISRRSHFRDTAPAVIAVAAEASEQVDLVMDDLIGSRPSRR